jgi:hypothetical protein
MFLYLNYDSYFLRSCMQARQIKSPRLKPFSGSSKLQRPRLKNSVKLATFPAKAWTADPQVWKPTCYHLCHTDLSWGKFTKTCCSYIYYKITQAVNASCIKWDLTLSLHQTVALYPAFFHVMKGSLLKNGVLLLVHICHWGVVKKLVQLNTQLIVIYCYMLNDNYMVQLRDLPIYHIYNSNLVESICKQTLHVGSCQDLNRC